jgi:hypothetical protein
MEPSALVPIPPTKCLSQLISDSLRFISVFNLGKAVTSLKTRVPDLERSLMGMPSTGNPLTMAI